VATRIEHLLSQSKRIMWWAARRSPDAISRRGRNVHSIDRIKPLGSALLSLTVHLHEVGAVAAILICIAIVLDLVPFTRTPTVGISGAGGQAAAVRMQDSNAPKIIARPDVAAPAPRLSQSPVDAQDFIAPTLVKPARFSPAEAAPPVSPASIDPATKPNPDRGSADKPGIVGVWAPDSGTCSAQDFKDGLLPTVINAEGAWAGETFCLFTKRTEIEGGWRVVAKCSTARQHWTSQVRLTVNNNRLIWASQRGTQAYSRCAPEVLMAQAK